MSDPGGSDGPGSPGSSNEGGAVIVVMGVSGCGKSTIAELLGAELGAHVRDGDELHPPGNVDKMSSGIPLTDEDRRPWLEAVRDYAARAAREHGLCIVACSALKRRYRDILDEAGTVFYVFLQGSRELIGSRMHLRTGHFMPEDLLESQFAALENPIGEPRVVAIDITPEPEIIARAAAEALRERDDFSELIAARSSRGGSTPQARAR